MSRASFLNLHYGGLFKIPRKIVKHLLSIVYPLVIAIWRIPKIKTIEETILTLLKDKKSLIRYGDSEMLYILDKLNLPYQEYSKKLANELRNMLSSDKENILVGLPDGYRDIKEFEKPIQTFWRSQISYTMPRLLKYLNKNKQYYNANITRLYYGYIDKEKSSYHFTLIRKLWKNRNVVLIEGEKSRLGAGNDLFEEVNSLYRILGPAHHAYRRIEDLYIEALKLDKNNLILVAMGPTAKVLVYRLANEGYQAIDIGNLDLEYEWFKMGAKERVVVKGKYTSEVKGGRIVEDLNDPEYEKQIITRICKID